MSKIFKHRSHSNKLLLAMIGSIVIATTMIFVLVLGGMSKQANAAAETYSYENSYLTKNVQAPSLATFEKTFEFTFTPYAYNGDTEKVSTVPALTKATQEIPIKVTNGSMESTADETLGLKYNTVTGTGAKATGYIGGLQLSKFMPTTFSSAGEYTYVVTETGPTADTGWTNSKSQYYLRVYVINDTAGLKIDGSTFEQSKDDFGNQIEVLKKDPTWEVSSLGGTTECKKYGSATNDTYVYNGFTFMNSYEPVTDLQIKNVVTGTYSDMTLKWSYSITLKNASIADGTKYTAYVDDNAPADTDSLSATDTVDFTFSGGEATASSIKLMNGGTITFDGNHGSTLLPVSTTYGVTETIWNPYTASAKTKTSALTTEVTTQSTAVGDPTISYSHWDTTPNTACILGMASGTTPNNYSIVTNTWTNDYPTGVLVNIAPYLILLGLPICAIVAWLLVRRAKKNRH